MHCIVGPTDASAHIEYNKISTKPHYINFQEFILVYWTKKIGRNTPKGRTYDFLK